MTILILDMPEEMSDLCDWLTHHLTGPSLAEVVSELMTIHQSQDCPTLDDVFGTQLNDVLSTGLEAHHAGQIQQLLLTPTLLLDLQERIACEGGSHWLAAAVTHESTQLQAASHWNTATHRRRHLRQWKLAGLVASIVAKELLHAQPILKSIHAT